MTREGEGAILEVKVSEMEKEPFGPEKEDRQRSKAAHPPARLFSSVWWGLRVRAAPLFSPVSGC